ncbi:MAG: PKD domain-containing protein, partial [Nanoarchaeota archaeon]|nr:PKD domain-containing protein [Nanoarchaeota archaeon]
MKTRILIFAIVFLLAVNIAFSYSLDVGLDKKSYGPQKQLEGNITLNVSGLPINTKLIIELNGLKSEKNLNTTCSTKKDAIYSVSESGLSSAEIDFDSAGTNTDYALDINTYSFTTPSSVSVDGSMKITGSQNPTYPSSPSLDINADGSAEWEYIGPLIKNNNIIQYIEIPPEYLFDLIPSDEAFINGMKVNEYCENITLPLSQSYKISVYVKTVNPNGKLKARIRTKTGYVIDSEGNKAECTIEDTSNPGTYAKKSCEISNENSKFIKEQDKNYFICVYSDGESNSAPYYKIDFENPTAINQGYMCSGTSCSYSNGLDYFIIASYGNYTREFNGEYIASGDIIKNNLRGCRNSYKDSNGFVHCLYPLKFSSKSAGTLTISNINIIYNPYQFDTLSKISYTPELFICSEKNNYYFNIPDLIDLTNVITPKEPGTYTLTLKLKDSEKTYDSDSVDLKVVPAPSIVLNIPETISLNISTPFNSSVSGNEPFNYSWEFGDGATSTEKNPIHLYKDIGKYQVILEVTDKDGYSETANKTIQVISVYDTLNLMLNTTRDTLTKVSSELDKATGSNADAINALKLKQLMNDISFNLTKYESQFKQNIQSTTKSAAAKEQDFSSILQSLLTQRANIPSSIDINSITYDSKLNSYYEIPDELFSYGQDADKEGVFELQNQLSVKSDSYSISIGYLAGNKEDFRLVRKQITVSGDTKDLYVVEYIPKITASNIEDINIMTPGFTIVEKDPIIKWPASSTMQIIYKLDSGA